MDASVGDYNFARFSTTTRVTVPLPGRLVAGAELGAGASGGIVPLQSLWFLGGPATLRGYAGGTIAGPDFWRGRLEVANSFPGARVALFSDAGWAGRGDDLATGQPIISAGAGVSFLDGLLRIDLSQSFERVIKGNHVRGSLLRDGHSVIQRNLMRPAAALCVSITARVIDENATHDLRRDSEKMRTVGPVYVLLIDETNVSFVN